MLQSQAPPCLFRIQLSAESVVIHWIRKTRNICFIPLSSVVQSIHYWVHILNRSRTDSCNRVTWAMWESNLTLFSRLVQSSQLSMVPAMLSMLRIIRDTHLLISRTQILMCWRVSFSCTEGGLLLCFGAICARLWVLFKLSFGCKELNFRQLCISWHIILQWVQNDGCFSYWTTTDNACPSRSTMTFSKNCSDKSTSTKTRAKRPKRLFKVASSVIKGVPKPEAISKRVGSNKLLNIKNHYIVRDTNTIINHSILISLSNVFACLACRPYTVRFFVVFSCLPTSWWCVLHLTCRWIKFAVSTKKNVISYF